VKLYENGFAPDLIESHIKGAFPCQKNILSIIGFFFNSGNLKHQRNTCCQLFVFYKVGDQYLFELRSTEA